MPASNEPVKCSSCKKNPPRAKQRTCLTCHASHQRDYRVRVKTKLAEMKAALDRLTPKVRTVRG